GLVDERRDVEIAVVVLVHLRDRVSHVREGFDGRGVDQFVRVATPEVGESLANSCCCDLLVECHGSSWGFRKNGPPPRRRRASKLTGRTTRCPRRPGPRACPSARFRAPRRAPSASPPP